MQEMFEASVDGEAYDADRWSQYFRPAGMQARTGDPNVTASPQATAVSQSAPAATPTPAPAAPVAETTTDTGWQEPAPAAAPAAEATTGDANDILAMIRARQSQ
jgi:cell division septation protein DedD